MGLIFAILFCLTLTWSPFDLPIFEYVRRIQLFGEMSELSRDGLTVGLNSTAWVLYADD